MLFPQRIYSHGGKFFESDERIVKREMINGKDISTVFLGLDHSHSMTGADPPLVFETMVFEPSREDQYQERCYTWKQA